MLKIIHNGKYTNNSQNCECSEKNEWGIKIYTTSRICFSNDTFSHETKPAKYIEILFEIPLSNIKT